MIDQDANYINQITGELHDSITDLYELLMDRDFEELNLQLSELIQKLQDLQSDIQDS